MKPINDYLIELSQPLIDKIKTEGGVEFYIAPEMNFEWNVSVTGKIVAIPENGKLRNDHIKVNDEVAISYMVVNERKFTGDRHIFKPFIDIQYHKQYYNGKGEWLRITGLVLPGGKALWVGTYTDKNHKLIDGVEGSNTDMDRWLSQFPMSNSKNFVFKNLVVIDGKEYWKVDKELIFAKKLKNRLFSCSEYILCKPILLDLTQRISIMKGIHLAQQSIMTRYVDRATVVSGGAELGINKDDIISFEEKYINKYTLFGEEYFLIKDTRVNGKWQT